MNLTGKRKLVIATGSILFIGIATVLFVFSKDRNLILETSPTPTLVSSSAPSELQVISSVLTNPSTVEVTFTGKMSSFNAGDLAIKKAQGAWYGLEPLLSAGLPVSKVTTSENKNHQTVAVLELEQKLNEDATFPKEEIIVPGKAPYFTADYYTGSKEQNIEQANHLITWQMDNGGWFKKYGQRI
ncbi:hypothetical protein [Paenibacillus sp. RC67]|uniref:hypothetical protein n=1 Tax=Paenibacillus sp. RC67 TaxID=3039392 RepID=UPI0024AD83DE|nr:hypothetical protein [Paenibacillus sp. RC67]